jgi:hypothetical protein
MTVDHFIEQGAVLVNPLYCGTNLPNQSLTFVNTQRLPLLQM